MLNIKSELNNEHKGNVTFEFIIILSIFALLSYTIINSSLMDQIYLVIKKITDYITNNNNSVNELWVN